MPAARNKRTRQGTVDDPVLPAADVWEVEKFLARATGKHGKKYLTRWKGYDSKADTYEPESNLLGSKELLAEFNKEQDALVEADHKAAKEKHEQAVAAKRLREEVTRHTPARLC